MGTKELSQATLTGNSQTAAGTWEPTFEGVHRQVSNLSTLPTDPARPASIAGVQPSVPRTRKKSHQKK